MDTPPGGNAIDVDTLAGALSCLNVKAKLPGSTPMRSHGKRKRGVGSKRALYLHLHVRRLSILCN